MYRMFNINIKSIPNIMNEFSINDLRINIKNNKVPIIFDKTLPIGVWANTNGKSGGKEIEHSENQYPSLLLKEVVKIIKVIEVVEVVKIIEVVEVVKIIQVIEVVEVVKVI